ncbi:MAG TPA: PilZ domain-containing protein [Myxococcota bacterium]|nr:PilZ domain-containing protein [Myxococcota bacterium]
MVQATTNRQLSLGLPRAEKAPRIESRMEPREETVRRVEYSAFPRVGDDTATRIGFTRNVSPSGMAIGVEEPLPVGTLLRVLVQRADGKPDFDAVARVAWCHESRAETPAGGDAAAGPGPDGTPAFWLGLVLVAEVRRGLARVPRSTAMPLRRSA